MDNMAYLFAAYSIIWTVVFGFLFYLIQKQRKLRRDLDSLKDHLDKKKM